MFKTKEVSIRFKVNHAHIQFEKVISKLGEKQAMLFLEETSEKYGPLVIEKATETEIILTTLESSNLNKQERTESLIQEKLDQLNSQIIATITEKMHDKQWIVFVKGDLEGVYSTEQLTSAKVNKLKELGCSESEITIEEIIINQI